MSKAINIKESLLKVVNDNNLEILKIDLCNNDAAFARFIEAEMDESCKIYTTLESLDFEEESIWGHYELYGVVYCQDKDTKEPVWMQPCGDLGMSWWEVNRVPDFYKDKLKELKVTL